MIHNTSEKRRFSVIIPLYNKAPYIRKALESVVAQTYRDFELIIVDDGSIDNSLNVVQEYVRKLENEKHPISHFQFPMSNIQCPIENIRIISQPNAGVAAARNTGVAASCGQFLCFLDADDWWAPTFLEEIDKLIAEYPDAGIYCTNYIYYKPGKTHVALKLQRGYMNYPEAYLHGEMPVTSITTCMPRRVFDEMGGFPVGIKLGEDFLLWAKIVVHYPVAFCEKPLAYYNNDVPASLRATRNLHAPEHHMLFHLDSLEEEIVNRSFVHSFTPSLVTSWKQLLDKLRVSGLLEYWLSDEYHASAASELAKVDWSRQPRSAKAQYEKPIWLLKAHHRFMQLGSCIKQKLIKLIKK